MTFTELDATLLGAILEGIFYGAYVVLFILYLVIRHRNQRAVDAPLTLAQILLFSLCTISLCLDIPADYFSLIPDVEKLNAANKLNVGSMVIFALIDYLAQMILLYRCWVVWDQRWVVVAIPGFLALVTLGGGFALAGLYNSFFSSSNPEKTISLFESTGIMTNSTSLVVNALTTSLIVTKIYLTSREMRPGLGSNLHRSLRIITAMLIESGLLMFAFQLMFLVLFAAKLPAFGLISTPITHIYGITPTILSIRVVMGSAYDKTTEKTRSLQFAHSRGAATTRTTDLSGSVAGAQESRVADIDLDEVSQNGRVADTAV